MKSLSIIIPAYNEELRLPNTLKVLQEKQAQFNFSLTEVLVVDDGSKDGTAQLVNDLSRTWPILRCLKLPQNAGKGAAVHAGFREAQGEWMLMADADMATPWDELNKFGEVCESFDLVMGSRALAESQITVRQHIFRQTLGRGFNKILRALVRLPYKDTQCGFKLVRNDADFKKLILPALQVHRFAWDVELILVLRKFKKRILESPVRWSHQEASRVRIIHDSLEMLWITLQLRLRGL